MKRFFWMTGCFLTLLSTAAFAADPGWYLGVHGGGNILQGSAYDSREGGFNFEHDPGYAFGATFGYDLGKARPDIGYGRVELEVSYRQNDVDAVEFRDSGDTSGGDVTALSAMVNTWGELQDTAPYYPYVGAGLGAARISLNDITTFGAPFADDSDVVFAWQAGAGVGMRLAPHFLLDLGYRYFSAVDPSFTDVRGVKNDGEYDTHTVLLGARVDF